METNEVSMPNVPEYETNKDYWREMGRIMNECQQERKAELKARKLRRKKEAEKKEIMEFRFRPSALAGCTAGEPWRAKYDEINKKYSEDNNWSKHDWEGIPIEMMPQWLKEKREEYYNTHKLVKHESGGWYWEYVNKDRN